MKKKQIITLTVILAIAAGGYFAYKKLRKRQASSKNKKIGKKTLPPQDLSSQKPKFEYPNDLIKIEEQGEVWEPDMNA